MKYTLLIATLILSAAVHARPVPPGAPGVQAPYQQGPAAMTQRGLERLVDYLQNGDGNLAKLAAYLERQVAPHFDFDYMAKVVAGPLYRRMDDGQKKRLAQRIKRQFLAALVERLGEYDSQAVKVVNQRLSRDGRTAVVTAAIRGAGSYPARLDFRFYKSRSGWKVYDVAANGQSAVVHYRNSFRHSLQRVLAQRQQRVRR